MKDFQVPVFSQFHEGWALATAGTPDHCNTMTIGWGGLGTLWSRNVCTIYVKPCRYTHQFLEQNDYFTVSFFPEQYREALSLLGRKSGRDGDKIAEAGLTRVAVEEGSTTFAEASCTLVCRKLYTQQLDEKALPEEALAFYKNGDPVHTMFVGEVVRILEK